MLKPLSYGRVLLTTDDNALLPLPDTDRNLIHGPRCMADYTARENSVNRICRGNAEFSSRYTSLAVDSTQYHTVQKSS